MGTGVHLETDVEQIRVELQELSVRRYNGAELATELFGKETKYVEQALQNKLKSYAEITTDEALLLQISNQQALSKTREFLDAYNEASTLQNDWGAAKIQLDKADEVLGDLDIELRREILTQRSLLSRTAAGIWDSLVTAQDNSVVVRNPEKLQQSYALHAQHSLELLLRRFLTSFAGHLIRILKSGLVCDATVRETNSKTKSFRLEWNVKPGTASLRDVLQTWTTMLVYVNTYILTDDTRKFASDLLFGESLHEFLGVSYDDALLMPDLMDALKLAVKIPEDTKPQDLAGILSKHVVSIAEILDPFLASIRTLLPKDSKLFQFAITVDQLYVDTRHCQLLNQARDVLNHNDFHSTVRIGEKVGPTVPDSGMRVFETPECSISSTAHKIFGLVNEIMEQAVANQTSDESSALAQLSPVLYKTARQVLDLYRAIVPVKFGREIASIPRAAAIFHNDCVYFAHHCGNLGIRGSSQVWKGQ